MVKLSTLTLTTTTEGAAPPAALTPLLSPSPNLAPDARLALKVTFAVMLPSCLVYQLSSTPALANGARIAPGAYLVLTVVFAAALPGCLLLPAPFSHQQSRLL